VDRRSKSGGVFINYRRIPDLATAGRLFDSLNRLLPDTHIFMDVDSLPAGKDFVAELGSQIDQCSLVLVVISPLWAEACDDQGSRLLARPEDFVRYEIESALRLGKQIVPVLIGDAKMPLAVELPPSIAQIAKLNAVSIRHENFQRDCQLFAEKIKPFLTNHMSGDSIEELDAFNSESARARELVALRPVGWEYLLIAELWGNYLKAPLRHLRDMTAGFYSIRRTPLTDDHASLVWIQEQVGAAAGMIDPLQKLMSVELQRAWGAPGIAGDPREILHVCKLMQRAAQIIVDWEENVRSREVTDKLKAAYSLLPGIAARQLEKIKDLPATLVGAVDYAIANPGKPHEVYFEAVFDLPDGWEKKFQREIRKLDGRRNWW
jgi:TIR domain